MLISEAIPIFVDRLKAVQLKPLSTRSYAVFATVTETFGDRLELGYGVDELTLNDLLDRITTATGLELSDDTVYLHNFNARLALLKEGEFDQYWLRAVTFGVSLQIQRHHR